MIVRVRYLQIGDKIKYTGNLDVGGQEFIEITDITKIRHAYTLKLKGYHSWELYGNRKVEIQKSGI